MQFSISVSRVEIETNRAKLFLLFPGIVKGEIANFNSIFVCVLEEAKKVKESEKKQRENRTEKSAIFAIPKKKVLH